MTLSTISTSTLANQNISGGLLVHTYTADTMRKIHVRTLIDQVTGGGDYSAYIRVQRGGVGSFYELLPITTGAPNGGITSVGFVSLWFIVTQDDVVRIYVLGQAGDVATPDIITEIFDETVTVCVPAASVGTMLSAVSGSDLIIYRGDTFDVDLAYLGDLTGWEKVWWTVKKDKDNTDAQSQLQVIESNPGVATDGLLWVEGLAPTAVGNGSITVTSVLAGNITIRVEAIETAKLIDCGNFYYDIQFQTATNTVTLVRGRCTILGDVTRTV